MKTKKLFLPIMILAIAILAMAAYSVLTNIAKKPSVTEGEFSFSITYELDGEMVTIRDVYKARYVKNDGYADTKERVYVGEIGNLGEDNTIYTLKTEGNTRVELWTNFCPEYLLGDSACTCFDREAFEPRIYYYDNEEQVYSNAEELLEKGVRLVSFAYPTPIENTFVFSHISRFSGEITVPLLLIALAAMGAILLLVKKENGAGRDKIEALSVRFHYIIGFAFLPFVTILGMLIDIDGGGTELYYQLMYFIPAFAALCLAASIMLRRNGQNTKSLVVQWIGPAVFAVYLIVYAAGGLL